MNKVKLGFPIKCSIKCVNVGIPMRLRHHGHDGDARSGSDRLGPELGEKSFMVRRAAIISTSFGACERPYLRHAVVLRAFR
ncbi:hypothetical protein C1H46_023861 [Malus baccata]|uniref:Uncharacterized protein n=1 Tax=Malus baccata TaxID=106549 RepID=A0A540LVP4_MALBA|nr:hypothetical protein C1H46_023861 [Malus baccata]